MKLRGSGRASAKLKLSPPHPWYYTIAGTECQEIAYAGLCEDLGSFAHTRHEISSFAEIIERSSTFRVPPPRVRWR